MKPEYIGIGNFDEDNYVYAHCKCPLPADYAIKWPRIKDGKPHRYTCVCEDCGTEVGVISKSYGPEVLKESGGIKMAKMLWECERCGKLIPYMADFCHDCAYELLGEPPKPFKPPIENEDKCENCDKFV